MYEAFTFEAGAPEAALPFTGASIPSVTPIVLTKGSAPGAVMTLLDLDAYDAGNVTTSKYAGRGLIYSTPALTIYEPRLISAVTISQDGMDAIGIGGRAALTAAEIVLSNADRALDTMAADGLTLGRKALIRTMPAFYGVAPAASDLSGGNLSNVAAIFSGTVAALTPAELTMRLHVADATARMNVPLQAALYDGTGGTGGPANLKGAPKPVTLGYVQNITPVALGLCDFGDGSLPTYQSHGRAILEHAVVRIRGVLQARVNSAPAIGQYRDWQAYGCFQLGSSPDGDVTADLYGDYDSNIYSGDTSAIVKRLCTDYGAQLSSSTEIDAASFIASALLLPGEIGWFHGPSPITQLAALDEVLGHTGAWLAGGRDGKLRLSIAQGNLAQVQATVETGNIVALEPAALPVQIALPPSEIRVGYAVNWTPLANLAGSVSDADKAALSGTGGVARSASATIAARVKPAQPYELGGLYRYAEDAQRRADALRTWIETGLQAFRVTIDRYRGQINLGDVVQVTSYPRYGLGSGFTGVVASWAEDVSAGQVAMVLVG